MDAWKDGRLYRADELMVSAYDHGFLYGLGFFETFRTYSGKVFLWDAHWNRLCQALSDFRIAMPYEEHELLSAIEALTEANNMEDGYFRLNISAGIHDVGLQPSSYKKPTVILYRKELYIAPRGTEKNAVWLDTVRNTPESGMRHKSHHYANNVHARFEVESLASYEGFFLTAEGFIAEGITSNIFWSINGKVYTPSLETGILAGTTREWVMNCSLFDIEEGFFNIEVLEKADEVFITNAVQEITPIKQLGSIRFLGKTGPVYNTLHDAYTNAYSKKGLNDEFT
ncbi:aminodeoxychorismate lyase [Psychrobacillus sp. INOP01]|uniref:aminodeoxychorismate lyase n=1 Tax=Psychrobacillus sp. INOP01 TaxID=2829187 RepID=UPI001BA9CF69|nr:aminodeoxychorismate lyase [Psychrobacillus sp. INOP01]QUG39928.1 aminodeoxychorismate lyase [Psychrobacillus sp. INOP01]